MAGIEDRGVVSDATVVNNLFILSLGVKCCLLSFSECSDENAQLCILHLDLASECPTLHPASTVEQFYIQPQYVQYKADR